jgi:tRNA-specific 2-thiouridylase
VKEKIVVAMSGGVDSSVAAALLKEEGYEVIGVTMKLFSLPRKLCRSENLRSCCGWLATEDAHRVAIALGIPHYVADFRKAFEETVIADFCREYAQARTPNPCIRCNEFIKFQILMERAKKWKVSHLATGHHARVEHDPASGCYVLRKGKDRTKDQSYFLYTLTQEQLAHLIFPIGNLKKSEVRRLAAEWKLPVAEKPESQEICFVPDRDYGRFLQSRMPAKPHPGPILDTEGRVLGKHEGIIHFTIGQRRGMGISAPRPLYVLSIDPGTNSIVVGSNDQLFKKALIASQVSWISGQRIDRPLQAKAKIRYRHPESEAEVIPLEGDRVEVRFEKPQRAITPGQAVVFYSGDRVLGGGIIDRVQD